jgi:UDP-N-acetyl-2-amino-2-deoxyglucuronate dehydrogenase
MAVRLALIGCGGISERHVAGYGTIKEKEPELFDLVAVCDADRQRAEAAAEKAAAFQGSRPRVFTEMDALLNDANAEAADVCTPHFLHHQVGVQALEAGLHVQVEKPIGVTLRATRRLIEAAQRQGRILATAENIRRTPGPRTAHWLFHERKLLGRPTVLYSLRVRPPAPQGGAAITGAGAAGEPVEVPWVWRRERALSGGGPVIDSGAHFCDTVRYLFGDAESCYGRVMEVSPRVMRKDGKAMPVETEDTFIATITFKSGVVADWSVSMGLPGHLFSSVAYYGTEGAIVEPVDAFHGPRINSTVVLRDGSNRPLKDYYEVYLGDLGESGRQKWFPHGIEDGFALETYDFLTAIRDGRPVEIDGEEGLKAKAIALAIYESDVTGQVVRVDDILSGAAREYQRPIDERWGL